ncbi:hypothetical protein [Sphaerisporangium aureirubrum]|uniref:DUF1490 domain-containing protein n=1 Tax=Sphaerisporangium aureirubrum TaxID=1544736 RepID=A0ABW1NPM4_9ACTN
MIRRLFYFALGAYAGVWAMRKLQALKPDHIARRTAGRAAGLLAEARGFTGDVRRLSAARETELHARLGLDTVGHIHHHDEKDGR